MDISIVGAGHVGLVTGACFADLGNQVMMVDHDRERIARLKHGHTPFFEPGLDELVHRGALKKRLRFTTSLPDAVEHGLFIFICVGTPSREDGEADLSAVENVCRDIAKTMRSYRLIVEKSTVPVETGEWIKRTLRAMVRKGVTYDVASNPEFLREGSGVHDFLHPDRVVLGVETQRAKQLLLQLYQPLQASMVVTDIKSAELIKHASNSFLAMKISYINAVSQLCDRVGADVVKVAEGMGLDPRIGRAFLDAGIGYGGYCFPKDVAAFIHIAEKLGVDMPLLKATASVNALQRQLFVKRIEEAIWNLNNKTIGVLGLSFKPNTDDVREAPSLEVIRLLRQKGARIRAFDPKAAPQVNGLLHGMTLCKDVYETARGADCLVILTEWNEFKELEFERIKKLMRQPVIIDGRNMYDPGQLRRSGFRYLGVGRGHAID
ncbi:MAG: UDP-glucose/GDP-mannose dehydrogenase family protein [Candidatus Omnitrophica bacterium]|nr:UDP-glucose/GDP-mannose dehydrogenase family protein [Candidatus Omnitrophota bacterium]